MEEKSAAMPGSPASPTPSLQIPTTPAPGLRGQGSKIGGMAPRQTFAPVNAAAPMSPDAGASSQKAMEPPSPKLLAPAAPAPMMKLNSAKGNEGDMGTTAIGTRPLRLQDMLKTAMAESAQKVNVTVEATRQLEEPTSTEKTASAENNGDGVDLEYALKLASAVEMINDEFVKTGTDLAGPYNLTENKQEVGKGPGALKVMEATATDRQTDHQGHGHNTVPMRTGTEKVHKPEHGATANATNMDSPAGLHATQTTAMSGGQGKTAGAKTAMEKCSKCGDEHEGACKEKSAAAKIKAAFTQAKTAGVKTGADAEKKETEGMEAAKKGLEKAEKAHESEPENKEGSAQLDPLTAYMLSKTGGAKTKTAEDAINPAQISAGKAVPPETSEAGQPGGAPVGGKGEGPSGLVGSNESAQHYKKNQAYAPRKAELGKYFAEPALTMSTDKTLAEAFSHTGEAGTKFASAGGTGGSTKVAAARAVIAKLAEEAAGAAKDNRGQTKEAAPSA